MLPVRPLGRPLGRHPSDGELEITEISYCVRPKNLQPLPEPGITQGPGSIREASSSTTSPRLDHPLGPHARKCLTQGHGGNAERCRQLALAGQLLAVSDEPDREGTRKAVDDGAHAISAVERSEHCLPSGG